MMPYADFAFYTDEFLGSAIVEEDFRRLALRASERIDMMTYYRAEGYVKAHPDDRMVKKAVCAIAEMLQQLERENALIGGGASRSTTVLTEITGKYHIQYAAPINTANAEGQSAIDQALFRASAPYLYPTGMLYAGVKHPCR